ncbi:hypothetical protein CC80DRAFT_505021 [Byssothecium circinans]|uniref:Uncharacterized protein n=1 Tax=Byssothecium circinans TaxID=147558 RepID=A0A6A5TRW3_9PLEO|nr:hypothetical protein CC80DRAFT_505021 [Byssothecium circinans]
MFRTFNTLAVLGVSARISDLFLGAYGIRHDEANVAATPPQSQREFNAISFSSTGLRPPSTRPETYARIPEIHGFALPALMSLPSSLTHPKQLGMGRSAGKRLWHMNGDPSNLGMGLATHCSQLIHCSSSSARL